MKKFLTVALVAGLALTASSAVYANVCAFDTVPAATLLYPFVAFDYNNPIDGDTTLFAVTNVSSEAQIVHFVVWNDLSQHVLDFNVILSGYDVQTMNIRDIFYYGDLPNTGTYGSLIVSGSRRAEGPYCDPNPDLAMPAPTSTLYDRCNPATDAAGNKYFPGYPDYPMIPQPTLDLFKAKLQYSQTFTKAHANCSDASLVFYTPSDWFQDRSLADTTWMYITADVVWTCNRMFPDGDSAYWQDYTGNVPDANGYFDDEGPQRMVDNVLIGDIFWVNEAERFSEADSAVHVEADMDLIGVATPWTTGIPMSFYLRYAYILYGFQDYREPLPTAWAFRYIGNGTTAMDTYMRVWKGSDYPTVFDLGYSIDDALIWAWDCMPYTYYAWDEDENICGGPGETPWSPTPESGCEPNLLPLETQEVEVDEFNLCYPDGWMLFVWPQSNGQVTVTIDGSTLLQDWYQTWVGVKYTAYGDWSAALTGAVMANYNCFSDQVLPNLGINYDYVTAAP